MELYLSTPQKVKIELVTLIPPTPLLDMYLKDLNTSSRTNTCIQTSSATLFTVEQFNCPPTDKQNAVYTYNGILFSHKGMTY
jgi:hypothetical protein